VQLPIPKSKNKPIELTNKKNMNSSTSLKARIISIYTFLISANILCWIWAFLTFHDSPVLLASAGLAYIFGLRHAVDADHIAAIDNVTRKLMQENKRPTAVGFFFSLGHSTVVVLATILVAFTASKFKDQFNAFKDVGGVLATLVSAFFLLIIAVINIFIFRSVYATFKRVVAGGEYCEEDIEQVMNGGGLIARMCAPLYRLINSSWYMFPLGFLFGLGFETASEVGLLGMSASSGASGISPWSILVFPALFTAGMSLVDTTDGILMLGAYGWAFIKPIRKIYYNMTMTLVSIFIALLVGGIEALGLLVDQLKLKGIFWDSVAVTNEHFGIVGVSVIALFIVSWMISIVIYKVQGYEKLT
jgi:high-affinity nickel-transport protein